MFDWLRTQSFRNSFAVKRKRPLKAAFCVLSKCLSN